MSKQASGFATGQAKANLACSFERIEVVFARSSLAYVGDGLMEYPEEGKIWHA